MTRVYDLPPKWDGRVVEWRGWERSVTLLCGGPDWAQQCHACGSKEVPLRNPGVVHPIPGQTFRKDHVRRTKSGKEYVSGTVPVAAWPVLRLFASRCSDCEHDTVWDEETDEWWDLDHTDYGPEGSVAP